MKYIVLILLILLTLPLFGQTQLPEKKGIHQIGDSIIWNKSLPVYIQVSTGEDEYGYEKPFYLDTEGVNFIRTKWEVDSLGRYLTPQREQLWKIYADSRPPKTKVELIASNSYMFRGKTYYSEDLKAKLSSKDDMSGIKKIYYSINGANFEEYSDLIPFSSEKDIKFKFYSVDNVGNVESIGELSHNYDKNNLNFGIDNIAPITSINKTEEILSPRDTLLLSSEDLGVGVGAIYFRIDSSGYKPYDKPILLNNINDGNHTFEYYGLDWINNEEKSKIYSFYLDGNSPEINVEESVSQEKYGDERTLKISAIDNKSGVKEILVQLNEKSKFVKYIEPIKINVSHQKIIIVATDNMGNKSVRTISYSKK